ncbi:MAG: hypothetical protein ACREQQ_01450, partial [Candidatus Binatia bacterium]
MDRMRTAALLHAIPLAMLLAGVGCAPKMAPSARLEPTPAVLLPLATGNEWAYDVRNATGDVSRLTMRVKGARYIPSRGTEATIVEESGGVPGAKSLQTNTDVVAYYLRNGFLFRSAWLFPRGSALED